MNQSITVDNDMYWKQRTSPRNFLQGENTDAATSAPGIAPGIALGTYPLAATDGDLPIHWQPTTRAASNFTIDTSKVEVQLTERIKAFWGERTPLKSNVYIMNSTNLADGVKLEFSTITPSAPYVDSASLPVVNYPGNSTEYILSDSTFIYSGNFVILEVEGCQGCGNMYKMIANGTLIQPEDENGATVLEFEVFGLGQGTDVGDVWQGDKR